MSSFFRIFLLIVWLFGLEGCFFAAAPKKQLGYYAKALDLDKSRIIIYREANQGVEHRYPFLYIDGVSYGRLLDNSYLELSLDPGKHELVIRKTDGLTNIFGSDDWPVRVKSLDVTVLSGQEVFTRYSVKVNRSVFDWHDADFTIVQKESALVDLGYMVRMEPVIATQD